MRVVLRGALEAVGAAVREVGSSVENGIKDLKVCRGARKRLRDWGIVRFGPVVRWTSRACRVR